MKWLETFEGREFLDTQLSQDISRLSGHRMALLAPGLDSEALYHEIETQVDRVTTTRTASPKKHRRVYDTTRILLQAAVLLLVAGVGIWFTLQQYSLDEQEREAMLEPERFETAEGQQLDIRLGDGSQIRLNEKSRLEVPATFTNENRYVILQGEAFFQVESDERSPFRIQSEGASVEVLGTEFSMNTAMGPAKEVVVAVREGRVALEHRESINGEGRAILRAGEIGILNWEHGSEASVHVENVGAANYLSWMNRRLQFQEMPLSQVCRQFYRIYGLNCQFQEEELKQLRLTTDISEFSMDRTLTIMAMSLDLEYELNGTNLVWRNQ